VRVPASPVPHRGPHAAPHAQHGGVTRPLTPIGAVAGEMVRAVPMRPPERSAGSREVVARALNAQTGGGGRRGRARRVRTLSDDLVIQKRPDRFGTRVRIKSRKSDLQRLTTMNPFRASFIHTSIWILYDHTCTEQQTRMGMLTTTRAPPLRRTPGPCAALKLGNTPPVPRTHGCV
jgi:hypothetical protein